MKNFFLTLLVFCLSCDISTSKPVDNINPVYSVDKQKFDNMSKAYFASGCFWCVETIYESLDGVVEVYSGYAGGTTINPNYYQVMSGKTGHAEAIEIIYDSSKVSFDTLLKVFFDSHNPTTPNRQGPDYGTQYRSIAFYNNLDEKKKIYVERFRGRLIFPINNISGQPIALGGRIIEQLDYLAKYINSPETLFFKKGANLFNLDLARKLSNKICLLYTSDAADDP